MTTRHPESTEDFEFIQTPEAPVQNKPAFDCGVPTTLYPAIKNAPVPADSPGSDSFSNGLMIFLVVVIPWYLARQVGGGLYTTIFFALFTTIPILMAFWTVASSISPRKTEKAKYCGRPVEYYLNFHSEHDRATYHGKSKIPMETFYEKYFNGEVDFKMDALEALEYRHDWANFKFTMGLFKHFLFGFIPEMLMHTRSQDEEQVRDHYDRGDDFYAWFLGPRMIYTSGIISDINKEETLEELQDNKLAVVCEKIGIQPGDKMLDLGCGWGTLAKFASVHYGAHVTGITLGRNQTAWGNNGLRKAGIEESQSRIVCSDYRDSPRVEGGYQKITCLEMAEHVGVRHFSSFLSQVYDMLEDDGVFFLQIAGFVVDRLEGAGFEIKAVDTIGVHYSATLWRWYRNWMGNKDKVEAKYGKRWFRIWEYFLASSTITSRQGGATCWQLTLAAIERANGVLPKAHIVKKDL
ncbi:Sphingolipid C9-methyltransferase 2 [Penicillium oxalicum]|uniref:Sphingolipid C9-methyltransferase 2 n=1 Tax=Penicillium oxalicum TaxID=69781 RepID=UPI0020B64482|nr:Sphingolipid C9-methyltransferase 2 [Penicillium oxalicum]KAI2791435.1 Sphingolipid C9-methyltransferase 2 [Penicillium oxalicum]